MEANPARRDREGGPRTVVWLVLGALAAALLTVPMDRRLRAARAGFAVAPAVGEEHPAWVQFVTVGLGGFRGVACEALWLRAGWLQEHGRYLELPQLAEWITALDPRATEAWVYNAWNLAYNISAMMPRAEDRLRWVAGGITLLRDRAIPANPRDARLRRELGWIYQNKIGGDSDDAHLAYKLALAASLQPYLSATGGAPAVASAAGRALRETLRLDPARMQALEAQFGPLDWRIAETHAIYWAWSGLPFATGFEREAGRRMVQQNLVACIDHGRFDGDAAQGRFTTRPIAELIAPTTRFFEESVREVPGERKVFGHFLLFVMRHRHAAGDDAAARASYARLAALAEPDLHLPGYAELLATTETPDDFLAPRADRP